jgi:hypothetical protein
MPNRIIKETICTSEDIAALSPNAEILFYRLIVKADDYGTYYGNPSIIKNTCFPLISDDIKTEQVKTWIAELANVGLVIYYEAADGKSYIKLTKWDKHQQIRAKKPKYPLFDDSCKQLISNDSKCPRNPIQSKSESNPIVVSTEPQAPSVLMLPVNDGSEYPITQADIDEWQQAFPNVDVNQQMMAMRLWLKDNPTRRKTKKGIRRFVTNWLDREQNRGGSRPPQKTETSSAAPPPDYMKREQISEEELSKRLASWAE